MSFLKCLICEGDVKIISSIDDMHKKIKCICCGYENFPKRDPEIVYKRKSSS